MAWTKIPKPTPPRCDLCNKVAIWQHAEGGRRCADCPRPGDYDFTGLTPKQQEVLTFQGWNVHSDRPQPTKATVARLIKLGMVLVSKRVTRDALGTHTVDEYEVPIAVHIRWCAYCAKKKGS